MSETVQSFSNAASQLQFNELIDGLGGFSKAAAEKILNNNFAEEVKKSLNSYGVENASDFVKKLVETASRKTVNRITQKVAIILTVIISIIFVIGIIVTLAAGGNIVIPIMALVILIAIVWVVTGLISNGIARKVSDILFKAIEERINQFVANKQLG